MVTEAVTIAPARAVEDQARDPRDRNQSVRPSKKLKCTAARSLAADRARRIRSLTIGNPGARNGEPVSRHDKSIRDMRSKGLHQDHSQRLHQDHRSRRNLLLRQRAAAMDFY